MASDNYMDVDCNYCGDPFKKYDIWQKDLICDKCKEKRDTKASDKSKVNSLTNNKSQEFIDKKCRGHDGYFSAKPDEHWRFLCRECFKKYYVPLLDKYYPSEIYINWDKLLAEIINNTPKKRKLMNDVMALIF